MSERINGIQGSYNQQTRSLLEELKAFRNAWISDLYQSLKYNEEQMAEWQAFLTNKR
jgi:hypothetical protein